VSGSLPVLKVLEVQVGATVLRASRAVLRCYRCGVVLKLPTGASSADSHLAPLAPWHP